MKIKMEAWIAASVALADDIPDPVTGSYHTLAVPCPSEDEAQVRHGLLDAAHHMGYLASVGFGDSGFVRFTAVDEAIGSHWIRMAS